MCVVVAVAIAALAGCGDSGDIDADTAVARAPVVVPQTPRAGSPDCPSDGQWKHCALFERLTRAGLAPRKLDDTTHVEFLPVPGIRYGVGRTATLTAFYFADSVAAIAATAGIDTVTVRPNASAVAPWTGTPVFIRSANLIAVFESDNARQIERIQLAITAGTP